MTSAIKCAISGLYCTKNDSRSQPMAEHTKRWRRRAPEELEMVRNELAGEEVRWDARRTRGISRRRTTMERREDWRESWERKGKERTLGRRGRDGEEKKAEESAAKEEETMKERNNKDLLRESMKSGRKKKKNTGGNMRRNGRNSRETSEEEKKLKKKKNNKDSWEESERGKGEGSKQDTTTATSGK